MLHLNALLGLILFVVYILIGKYVIRILFEKINSSYSHLLQFLKGKSIDIEYHKNKDNIERGIDIREKLRHLNIENLSELYYLTNDTMDELGVSANNPLYTIPPIKSMIGVGIIVTPIVFFSFGLISLDDMKNTGDIYGVPATIVSTILSVIPRYIFVELLIMFIYLTAPAFFLYIGAIIVTGRPKILLLSALKVSIERIVAEKEKISKIQSERTEDKGVD